MEDIRFSEKFFSSVAAGVCLFFEPQKWRKTKCKICFEDIHKHKYIKVDDDDFDNEGDIHFSTDLYTDVVERLDNSSRNTYELETEKADGIQKYIIHQVQDGTGLFSKSRPEAKAKPPVAVKSNRNTKLKDSERENGCCRVNADREAQEIDSDTDSTQMFTKYSRETSLSRHSTLDASSNSSLASYDALEDNTTSSLSHGCSGDTLDSMCFTSGDELDFSPSKNISDLKVIELEQEIENLIDKQKAVETGKDKQIQSLERELQNFKLEITNFSARENVSMLKNKLELEGKSLHINDLENEIQHLKSTIVNFTLNKNSDEDNHDRLQSYIHRCNQKIKKLEEENKTLHERICLAEDLQTNDRELLDVLRNQLNVIERDLFVSQVKGKDLEDKIKAYKEIEHDLSDERLKNSELIKRIENLSGKIKKRDRQMSCLEDDNVRHQHLIKEFEDISKADKFFIHKLDDKLKLLQQNINEGNCEIERLSSKNKMLEYENWQETLKQADASGSVQKYILQLEEKVGQTETKQKDLQDENNHLVKEVSELLETVVTMDTECMEIKNQLLESENKTAGLMRSKEELEKEIIAMQRKLKKTNKEKKRIQLEKTNLEVHLIDLRTDYEKVTMCEDFEKGYKMSQLKLQSTEAKLTMMEGNKAYIESKLTEYEKKLHSSEEILNEINFMINSHILDNIGELVPCDQNVYFENKTLEEKLMKILTDKKENQQLLSIVKERNCSLNETITSLERQLDEDKYHINCFTTENKQLKVELNEKSILLINLKNYLQLGLQQLSTQNGLLENKVSELAKLSSATTILENHLKTERHRAAFGRLETWSYKNELKKSEEKLERLKEDEHQLLIHMEYLNKLNQLLQLSVHTLEQENAILSVSSIKQRENIPYDRSKGKKESAKYDKLNGKQKERVSSEKDKKNNMKHSVLESRQLKEIKYHETLMLDSKTREVTLELESICNNSVCQIKNNDKLKLPLANSKKKSINDNNVLHSDNLTKVTAICTAPESIISVSVSLSSENSSNTTNLCLSNNENEESNSTHVSNTKIRQYFEDQKDTVSYVLKEKKIEQTFSKDDKKITNSQTEINYKKTSSLPSHVNLIIGQINQNVQCSETFEKNSHDFEDLVISAGIISKKIINEAIVLYIEVKNRIGSQEHNTEEQIISSFEQCAGAIEVTLEKENTKRLEPEPKEYTTKNMETKSKRPLTSVNCIFDAQQHGLKKDKPTLLSNQTSVENKETKLSVKDRINKYGSSVSTRPKEESKSPTPPFKSPMSSPRVSRVKPIKLNSALAVFEKQLHNSKMSGSNVSSLGGYRSRSTSDSSLIKRNRNFSSRQSLPLGLPPKLQSGTYLAKCESDTVKVLQEGSGAITLTIESSDNKKGDIDDIDERDNSNRDFPDDDDENRLPPLTPLFDRPRSGGRKPPSKMERTRSTTDVNYFDFNDL